MIFVIPALIIFLIAMLPFYDEWLDPFTWITAGALPTIILVVGVVVGFIFGWQPDPQPYPKTYLANLQDTSSVYGRFMLGSGTIGEYPAFAYYTQTGKSEYRYKQLVERPGTAPVVVFTDEEKRPYLKSLTDCKKPRGSRLWIAPLWKTCSIVQQEFHVPKNSIIRNFKLDASK